VDLPLAVATKCGFNGIFNLHDEIEYTFPRLLDGDICFNKIWRLIAVDGRFKMLASGTNIFAMAYALTPNINNTLAPLEKGVTAISLSVVAEDSPFMVDEFAKSLGGYPGYLRLYQELGEHGLQEFVCNGMLQDFENLKNILYFLGDMDSVKDLLDWITHLLSNIHIIARSFLIIITSGFQGLHIQNVKHTKYFYHATLDVKDQENRYSYELRYSSNNN